jgi:hypothetical protein
MQPGTVRKGYVFLCFLCDEQEVIIGGTQYLAEKYVREIKGWIKKTQGGWHCPTCKDKQNLVGKKHHATGSAEHSSRV